ncbi:hypothetical protein [Brucella pseudogrignonensis]|jgi:hypothetical protein|uniref:Uncharacterized protein n=1 Tax=Brucella pseudogrignonensis TaxID=419475 RepID=A0ABU1M873_9HYPH|nr:hypothetical protein [Brucella pseudogrignonensis]MDR6431956.1 hypothetical protein [Brucella pseudogrignonensis]
MVQRVATRRELLMYIEQMLEELIVMAKETNQPLLVYMMDMALQEAKEGSRKRKSAK